MTKKQLNIQARVLGGFTLDQIEYGPNDIIESDPALIKSLGNSVDASAESVAEALKLGGAVKQHEYKKPETDLQL